LKYHWGEEHFLVHSPGEFSSFLIEISDGAVSMLHGYITFNQGAPSLLGAVHDLSIDRVKEVNVRPRKGASEEQSSPVICDVISAVFHADS